MELSIKISIDSQVAGKLAEKLGMEMMVVGEDPMAPPVEVTESDIDTFLEKDMKSKISNFYSSIIGDIFKADLVKKELEIQQAVKARMEQAIKIGDSNGVV